MPDADRKVDCLSYLNVPDGKFPRDMNIDEIKVDHADVLKAKVKAIAGPYDLGCFKHWFAYRSNNIIDARWVTTWKVIEGNVGAKCRWIVRLSKTNSMI